MAARDVFKNLNLFVDGRGMAGQVEEVTPPILSLKLEEFRAGGMDAPLELTMGMEKLEGDFSLISYDRNVLALFGVNEGNFVPFTLRKALESFDGTVTPVVISMRGKIKTIDRGSIQSGEKASLKVSLALNYYKEEINGENILEIDVENMVRIVNGVDVLADQRAALGI